MTTKIEYSASQLSAAANIRKIWGDMIVNVKAYGAKGDGVTDDTAAIQAAIDAFTQRYTASPQHDVYSRGTLKTTNKRVSIFFPQGVYKISSTIDMRWRGFIDLVGDNAVIIAGNTYNGAMVDARYSNEMKFERIIFEAAKDGSNKFLHCIHAGGSDDKVADGYNSAKSVHFIDCEFRNASDTLLNLMNDTGTFKASVDACRVIGCFFAGGAVGIKYAGFEGMFDSCYLASQTYAGVLLYDNASGTFDKCLWTMGEVSPSILIDIDNNIDNVRFMSCYFEESTYIVQCLGSSAIKKLNLYFDGGRFESCHSGIVALNNRIGTLTLNNVHIGVSNTARTMEGAANVTLVLEQNQIEQDYNGAMLNLASWLGKIQRSGFLSGRPVNNTSYNLTEIYVDPTAGNDSNEGYTSGRALATIGEAFHRINDRGQSVIYLATGTDAAPLTYTLPTNTYQFGGWMYITNWEKQTGQTNPAKQRCIISNTNPYMLYSGKLTVNSVTLSGERTIKQFGGTLNLKACIVPCSSVNGQIFVQNGHVSATFCDFTGTTGVAFYVGDQYDGAQATLWGNSNVWENVGITKYQAYGGITTLVQSTL